MSNPEDLVIPHFKTLSVKNEHKTKQAGRPIYDDIEVVEVRFAGNRQTVSVFPAHEFCRWVPTAGGDQEKQTYAQRWPEQYRRFKAKEAQIKEGTPIDELPFLTQGKRLELKALSIYTAESLAALDGQELKNLGQGGRDLKNQAQAYLDRAAGTADVTSMAAKIAELERTIAELRQDKVESGSEKAIEDCTNAELKEFIKRSTGDPVLGNPSRDTLIARAHEIANQQAA